MTDKAISRVTVPSKWGGLYDTRTTGVAEFRLGIGPCGKTVSELRVSWDADPARITIRQYYEGGESKDFIYMAKDLTGRIKVTYQR